MATHSNVLAWRIPGMAEPGGLPSVGSHRVGHDWSDLAVAAAIFCCLSVPHLYPFLCRWTFRLSPCLDYCEVVVNSAAVDFGVSYIFLNYFCLDRCPGVGLPVRMIALFSVFWGPLYCSPWWLHWFTSPRTVSEDCLFSPPSPAFAVCRFSSDCRSVQSEVPHWSCDSAVIASFFPSWKSSIVAASVTLSTDHAVCISLS